MSASFHIKGGDRLQRSLRNMKEKVAKKIVRRAVVVAAKPIVKAARNNAARDSGTLAASLGVKMKFYRNTRSWVAIIGPRVRFKYGGEQFGVKGQKDHRKPAFYGHLVEGGTKRHFMEVATFGGVVYKAFQHPGAAPKPFLEPAFDENRRKAFRIMGVELWKGIRAEAKP